MVPQDPAEEEQEFGRLADEAEGRGDLLTAGIFRVAARDSLSRARMKKAHRPNLGPYSSVNPKLCRDCGKPGEQWVEGEECVPNQ